VRDRGPAAATATGNLARKFVALALDAVEFPPGCLEAVRRYNKVINEAHVGPLFPLRLALVAAGFLRRQRGFRITERGRAALEGPADPGASFGRLFLARMGVDGRWLDQEGLTFRSALGPALFLLGRHGADWVDSLKLTDRLLGRSA
jgi:hypothetical protein